jgi:hypothetical protein
MQFASCFFEVLSLLSCELNPDIIALITRILYIKGPWYGFHGLTPGLSSVLKALVFCCM